MRVAGLTTAAAIAAILAAGFGGCGGGGESQPTAPPTSTTETQARSEPAPPHKPPRRPHAGAPHRPKPPKESTRAAVRKGVAQTKPARLDRDQRQVAAVVRRYVDGLDSRDGAVVCSVFAPGAFDGLRLPRERGDCAASMSASIGYRDPRGFPVYEGSRVARMASVDIREDTARAVATTVTQFAGDREPSIEDDVVYLERRGSRWLIVKPSAGLYRAIGTGNIPPSVLAPPS
jgi:hypothetical protein